MVGPRGAGEGGSPLTHDRGAATGTAGTGTDGAAAPTAILAAPGGGPMTGADRSDTTGEGPTHDTASRDTSGDGTIDATTTAGDRADHNLGATLWAAETTVPIDGRYLLHVPTRGLQ